MNSPKVPPATLASPEEAEQQFYEALQHGELDRLMAVWGDEDEICCVHPAGPRLVGVIAIRELDRLEIGQGSRGPITETIQAAFFDIVNGRNPKYAAWLTAV